MSAPTISADLLRRYDIPGPRYTSYPTVPEWTELSAEAHLAKLEEAGRRVDEPLSLYVHVPFCAERCTFCGCNVVVARDRGRADGYIDRLAKEMDIVAEHLGRRRRVSEIHWGGGTPTFLSEDQLLRLHHEIAQRFSIDEDAAASIEIDPVVTTPAQLGVLRWVGFNRLSMGVQDFSPAVQKAINRVQTVEETRRMVDEARRLGFTSVNFDLIYGLPLQTHESWQNTLADVLAMRPDRLAVYSFAFLPEQRPHQKRLSELPIPTGDAKLELFRDAYQAFVEAGYRAIGMDHFALPGDELSKAQEQHRLRRSFMGYTASNTADCVAFGVSAISDIGGMYVQNVSSLPKYLSRLETGRLATERGFSCTPDDQRRRRVIEALMCNFWVDLGSDAKTYYATELAELVPFEKEGLLKVSGNTVELTPTGRFLVRNVAMVFDAHLRQHRGTQTFSRTV
ncbi:MAG: oxygen-independent coproporphyrinogen III oxidase [Myxococcota bacterium]